MNAAVRPPAAKAIEGSEEPAGAGWKSSVKVPLPLVFAGGSNIHIFSDQYAGHKVDRKAADAHSMTANTRAYREKLGPASGALYDERFYKMLN